MLLNDEDNFWAEKVKLIPRKKIVEWMREIHGNGFCEEKWLYDVEEDTGFPFLSFMDGTHICKLDLSDPPVWIVLKFWEYLE